MGATAVIMGNASGYTNGVKLNGFATVKIINASSGEIVAAVHEPSGLLFAYSVEQSVLAAVENVAKKVRQLIENWSLKSAQKKPAEIRFCQHLMGHDNVTSPRDTLPLNYGFFVI